MQRETPIIQDEENCEADSNLIGKVNVPMKTTNNQSIINLPLLGQNASVSLILEAFLVEESGSDIVAAHAELVLL